MKNWMSEFEFGDDVPAPPPPPPPHRPYLPYAPPGSVHALPPSELWHPKPTASLDGSSGDSDFGAVARGGRGGRSRFLAREILEPIGAYDLILAELVEGPVLEDYEIDQIYLGDPPEPDDFSPTAEGRMIP